MQHVLCMPMPGFKQSPLNKDNIVDDDIRPCCLLLSPVLCVALSFLHLRQQIEETRASGKSSNHQLSTYRNKEFFFDTRAWEERNMGIIYLARLQTRNDLL